MLTIIAIAPFDGWAYVKDNGHVFLIKPPYSNFDNKVLATLDEVEIATGKYGYYECDESFDNYSQLIEFLRDKKKRLKKEAGLETRSAGKNDIAKLLHHMPLQKLEKLADNIEENYLPNGKFQDALDLANDILKVDKVKANKDIQQRLLAIIKLTKGRLHQKEQSWESKFQLPKEMPTESIVRWQRSIATSHSIFAYAN